MEMRVITNAKHIVKPSSPTPDRFKHHRLSKLDQVSPSIYMPLIFFYQNINQSEISISRRLKESLSEILTVFYPLAGTIKENSFVDCNDTGAEFVEARVHGRRLAQLIQNPKMEELNQLISAESSSYNDDGFQLLVKTSYFDCGGIAVGVCFSHKIGDVASFVTFMNAWAATSREESSGIIQPCFDLALRFPSKESLASRFQLPKEKIVTERLVFDGKMVEKLRKQTPASRVVSVSAFIWRSFVEANRKTSSSSSFFPASHVVNSRPRTVPQIPDQTFGNCVMHASPAVVSSEEDEKEYVSKLEASIRAVNDDYINKVFADDSYFRALVEQTGDLVTSANCTFTSWRFPVYDVDFGWGKPAWVSTATMPFADVIVLMSTPSGDGIEAWVNYIPREDDDDFFKTLQANYNNLTD